MCYVKAFMGVMAYLVSLVIMLVLMITWIDHATTWGIAYEWGMPLTFAVGCAPFAAIVMVISTIVIGRQCNKVKKNDEYEDEGEYFDD
jgi:hypothetical protein